MLSGQEGSFHPFAWWVSREGQRMDYWAGAPPGSRMCQCGVLGSCVDPTKWCNCDSEYNPLKPNGELWMADGGGRESTRFLYGLVREQYERTHWNLE